MGVEQQPPDVVAIIIADAVQRDMATGKFSIQGTYSTIIASDFPLVYPAIVVYGALTDGHGKTLWKLRLVDVDEARAPLFEHEGVVNFADPISVVEFVLVRRNVVFPEPGEYRLQLFAADQLLKERRLQVVPKRRPGAP